MLIASRSSHRGCAIIARCSELALPPCGGGKRFAVSFSVVPPLAAGDSAWQEFPDAVFETSAGALAYALKAAKASIDQYLDVEGVDRPVCADPRAPIAGELGLMNPNDRRVESLKVR
jgi:hypothetical protein